MTVQSETNDSIGASVARYLPRRGRGVLLMSVLGGVAVACGVGGVLDGPWWWVGVLLFGAGAFGVGLQTFSPNSFLEVGDEGLVVSRPTAWGSVRRECFRFADCSEFRGLRHNSNYMVVFEHAPAQNTKSAALARAVLGFGSAISYVYQPPLSEMVAQLNRRRAECRGDEANLPRRL